jgi:hypothetical protein
MDVSKDLACFRRLVIDEVPPRSDVWDDTNPPGKTCDFKQVGMEKRFTSTKSGCKYSQPGKVTKDILRKQEGHLAGTPSRFIALRASSGTSLCETNVDIQWGAEQTLWQITLKRNSDRVGSPGINEQETCGVFGKNDATKPLSSLFMNPVH